LGLNSELYPQLSQRTVKCKEIRELQLTDLIFKCIISYAEFRKYSLGGHMIKPVIGVLFITLLLPAFCLADITGIGAGGGPLFPVGQEDQESGVVFGLKVRAKLYGPIAFEPNFNFGGYGDVTIEGAGTRVGSDIKYYGIDLTLGGGMGKVGPKPYVFIGGGVTNTKRTGDNTTNKSSWSFGSGIAVGVMKDIDIDIRGRMNIAQSSGSTSRKSVALTFGVVYFFGQRR
jgi:hypothetical protein